MTNRDVTRDSFLNGQVQVVQPASGYRAGLDAVLLAASLSAKSGDHLLEAGCGAGAALLCAAHRLADTRLTGIERDADMARLAAQGVDLNGFGGRVEVSAGDVMERLADLENAFEQTFSNPPFFEPGTIRAPAAGREGAYMAHAPLREWILFLLHCARPGGQVTIIHRAAALADLLELLNPRAGEIEVLPVRPAPGLPARRVLVRARKGLRRGPVTLYDGLALHDASGGPSTERAVAALAGGALEWI